MTLKRILRAILAILFALWMTIAAYGAERAISAFLREQNGKVLNIGRVIYCTSNFP